jgi:hypothetical protein
MGTQTDYFNKIGYKHTYDIGDRIFGYYKKIRIGIASMIYNLYMKYYILSKPTKNLFTTVFKKKYYIVNLVHRE